MMRKGHLQLLSSRDRGGRRIIVILMGFGNSPQDKSDLEISVSEFKCECECERTVDVDVKK